MSSRAYTREAAVYASAPEFASCVPSVGGIRRALPSTKQRRSFVAHSPRASRLPPRRPLRGSGLGVATFSPRRFYRPPPSVPHLLPTLGFFGASALVMLALGKALFFCETR